MGILSSTDLAQKFKPVNKDRLFYDRFQLCLTFDVAEASALRELRKDKISALIARRREWRQISIDRWLTAGRAHIVNSRSHREISPDVEDNLHTIVDLLQNSAAEYKVVTGVYSVWVYTDDLELIRQLSELKFINNLKYTRALVDRPKDTVRLAHPRHQQRSYFRSVKLTDQEKDNLERFFANHPDVRISPGMQGWFISPFHRTQDYFFIDYNESSYLTMLSLVRPGLIRKTSQIISA